MRSMPQDGASDTHVYDSDILKTVDDDVVDGVNVDVDVDDVDVLEDRLLWLIANVVVDVLVEVVVVVLVLVVLVVLVVGMLVVPVEGTPTDEHILPM